MNIFYLVTIQNNMMPEITIITYVSFLQQFRPEHVFKFGSFFTYYRIMEVFYFYFLEDNNCASAPI
jgi:hypothetical protein